jgi:hypothetical protein
LNEWCNKKKVICDFDHYIDPTLPIKMEKTPKTISTPTTTDPPCGSKYGLCKNTKPLFV